MGDISPPRGARRPLRGPFWEPLGLIFAFLFAIGVENDRTETTCQALEELFMLWNANPKAVCGDSAFFKESFTPYWKYKNI